MNFIYLCYILSISCFTQQRVNHRETIPFASKPLFVVPHPYHDWFRSLNFLKKGRKRPLDTPKRMIERREREGEREKER